MKGKHKKGVGGLGGGWREKEVQTEGNWRGEGRSASGERNTDDVVCCGPIKPQEVTVVNRGR